MKKPAILIVAGVFCASPAVAADLPSRAAPPSFVPPIVPVRWTGCYVGGFGALDVAHVGNTRTETDDTTTNSVSAASTVRPTTKVTRQQRVRGVRTVTTTTRVFTTTTTRTQVRTQSQPYSSYGRTLTGGDGGGRIGCNYQTGRFVFGGQLEGGYLGIKGTAIDPLRSTSFSTVGGGPYGALSGKFGYAIGEKTLVYIRGGVGFADLRYATADYSLNYYGSLRRSDAMPLIGAGLEYKLTSNISVTGEYTYMRPGCRSSGYTLPASVTTSNNGRTTTTTFGGGDTSTCVDKHMIAFGLNYYFNTVATPVVTRY